MERITYAVTSSSYLVFEAWRFYQALTDLNHDEATHFSLSEDGYLVDDLHGVFFTRRNLSRYIHLQSLYNLITRRIRETIKCPLKKLYCETKVLSIMHEPGVK